MTTYHGKLGTVKVGTNVVANTSKFSFAEAAATADNTPQGATWESHLPGFNSWSGQIDCMLDATDTTGQEALTIGASVTLNLYPYGAITGNKYVTGTATITALNGESSKDGVVTRSFQFKGNGAASWSTAP